MWGHRDAPLEAPAALACMPDGLATLFSTRVASASWWVLEQHPGVTSVSPVTHPFPTW